MDENIILPLLKYNKNTKKIAQEALENRIIPFPNFNAIPFDHKIWEYNKNGKETSYQLYIHSLRVVGELIKEYIKMSDIQYLFKAKEIIDSWITFSEEYTTSMTWYDHPTANRTQVIIELIYYLKKYDDNFEVEKYLEQLRIHCKYLENDKNYRPNNHGIMMDRALLSAGLVLNNKFYYLKGKSRLQNTFWNSYSSNGVHLENSPEYHLMVTKMYTEIESYLNKHDDTLGTDLNNMLDFSKKYLENIQKPDGYIPPIGDSSEFKINSELNWNNFNDTESGLTIIKDEKHELYLGFICGFSTSTHKHADDLSIVLNYKAKDYIIDSGKYNYSKTPERYYVVSNKAHSSFQLNEKYKKENINKYKKDIWTDIYFDSDEYTIVSGYNNKYENSCLRRTVYYHKKLNVVIIRDIGKSIDNKNWISRFNLSEKIKYRFINQSKIILSNEGDFISIKNITNQKLDYLDSYKNQVVEKPFYAHKVNQKMYNSQLIYQDEEKKETESIFCITFNDDSDIQIVKKDNFISIKNKDIESILPIISMN
ncbi:heparinase II/III domain-containing protein [Mammaliicoccus sciuri]|uniref:heparinase II/III domain-containing protein n=1 Tax=Mammaliicoccus sciuri TaxID=1296 RepID=UPI002B25CEF7|nr:heparinase II/III family protein [Mammaliicoccus sciuri]MEB6262251.1 heparinase II/III-family protein [Mammaliicoccus sciuri]WQK57565.1 heparinase II/III family protein [Mammaliicoccus sciuri]